MALHNSRDLAAAIVGQQVAIFGEGAQVQRAQPPRQPAVHELALLVREIDAGDLLDQLAQRLEVLVAEGELAHPGGASASRSWLDVMAATRQNNSTLPSLACSAGTAGAAAGAGQQQVEQNPVRVRGKAGTQILEQHHASCADRPPGGGRPCPWERR